MCTELINFISQSFRWENIASFLNSNFTAALAGAFAGALAAQKIGDRAKQREELLREIRNINAAISISFAITNTGLSLKKQYIKDIYDTFTAKKTELEKILRQRAANPQEPPPIFEFRADFRSLQMPLVPIDVLRTQVYEGISVTSRPLSLVATLSGVLADLEKTIQARNLFIERFRSLGPGGEAQLPSLYFGLPYGGGHVNTEHSDLIENLSRLTDDVIFFSELLIKDLMEHGAHILDQYKKLGKVKKEKISSVDFTEARQLGLMPDEENYLNWLRGFSSEAQPDA